MLTVKWINMKSRVRNYEFFFSFRTFVYFVGEFEYLKQTESAAGDEIITLLPLTSTSLLPKNSQKPNNTQSSIKIVPNQAAAAGKNTIKRIIII